SVPFKLPTSVPRMGWLAQNIIKDVLAAYNQRDAEKAVAAWQSDEEVDETYSSLFRELLTHMMEDPRNIGACTHMLFIAKNIERDTRRAGRLGSLNRLVTVAWSIKAKTGEMGRRRGDRKFGFGSRVVSRSRFHIRLDFQPTRFWGRGHCIGGSVGIGHVGRL